MTIRPTIRSTDGDEAAVTWWLALADRYPLLDVHTESELGRLARLGSKRARETLVNSNLRLAVTLAGRKWRQCYRFLDGCLTITDLIQTANEGLLRAAEDYDERRSRFTTHAAWWIRSALNRVVLTNEHAIRLPEYMRGEERTGARQPMLSLEQQTPQSHQGDDKLMTLGETLADTVPGPEAEVMATNAADDLVRRLSRFLTRLELYVVARKISLLDGPSKTEPDPSGGPTYAALGREIGCSRQNVQQAWTRALTQLRLVYAAPAAAAKTKTTKTPTKKSA